MLKQKLVQRSDKEFVYLKRHLNPDDAKAILGLGIPGVASEREFRRYYPSGEVMAHVLGFTNIDDRGQEGLELAFDDWLAGKPGMKRVIRDLHGQVVENVELLREAQPGRDLTLSIDRRIQYLAYRELKAALAEHHATSGSMVILDVPTGEVLAMVNEPSFNPNARNGGDPSMRRNRAVTDVVEPGSTIKAFTISAALESGKWKPHTPIDTSPGTFTLADGRVIRDVHNKGMLDVTGVITHSSNVGAAKIGLDAAARSSLRRRPPLRFRRSHGLRFSGRIAGPAADREGLGPGRAGDDLVRLRPQRDAAAARQRLHRDREQRSPARADLRQGRAESGQRGHRSRDRREPPAHARNGRDAGRLGPQGRDHELPRRRQDRHLARGVAAAATTTGTSRCSSAWCRLRSRASSASS